MTTLFTVTCRSRPLAIVQAVNPQDAVARARGLVARSWNAELEDELGVREPDEGEVVDWLRRRNDLLLPGADKGKEADQAETRGCAFLMR